MFVFKIMVLLPVPPDQVSRCPWARHL